MQLQGHDLIAITDTQWVNLHDWNAGFFRKDTLARQAQIHISDFGFILFVGFLHR